MAIVSSAPVLQESVHHQRVHSIGVVTRMGSRVGGGREEINEEEVVSAVVEEEKIYVAVGKDVKESKSTLLWALQNFRGKKICLLHVHQPAQMIPTVMGGKMPASKLAEQEVRAYRELEELKMDKFLNEYLYICVQNGVVGAEKQYIVMDTIEKGIVEFVALHGITRLVMGAAADKHKKKLTTLKSKKAIFAKESEILYANEVKQRKEMELVLAKETLELNKIKSEHDEVMEELRTALDQKMTLESQVADSSLILQELEGKIVFAVELLVTVKQERGRLQLERDSAIKEVEEEKRRGDNIFSEFSFSEIDEATRSFDPCLIIGEGGYGSVYKGFLRSTEVAIKLLKSSSLQGHSEFQQGPNRVMEFCNNSDLELIVRAHEYVMDGFEHFTQGHLITLFSVTNYCGTANNAATILVLGRDLVVVPKLIHPLLPAVTSPEASPERHIEGTWMQELNANRPLTPTRGRPQWQMIEVEVSLRGYKI